MRCDEHLLVITEFAQSLLIKMTQNSSTQMTGWTTQWLPAVQTRCLRQIRRTTLENRTG